MMILKMALLFGSLIGVGVSVGIGSGNIAYGVAASCVALIYAMHNGHPGGGT